MTDARNRDFHLGDNSLSTEEALERAFRVNVSMISSYDYPSLESKKWLVLQEGPSVTKAVECLDIRSTSTGNYKFSKLTFVTIRNRKTRRPGWKLETHRSITLGDENNPDVPEKLLGFLSSVRSLNASGEYLIVGSDSIDIDRLADAFAFASRAGQQSELLSKILEWIQRDPHAHTRLTQLSNDDLLRSKSLVAAINYGRYRKRLSRFQKMVDGNLPERDYQNFLEENYWLFGSEYSELLEERILVRGQQLDFPLRRTVDGYLEVIEIKTPLGGESGFSKEGSHNFCLPRAPIYRSASQVLNYLSGLKANNYSVLKHNKIDVTGVRGRVIIGRDGSEEEEEARKIFNDDSRSVEVMSFDSLLRMGERVLDIMVKENPDLKEIHSPQVDPRDLDVGEIPF